MPQLRPHSLDPGQVAEHDPFVRALLHRLVTDPHLAEDLAQDTWLAAIRHTIAASFFQRAWLGTVARNFALQSIRGKVRRVAREAAVARSIVAEGSGTNRDEGLERRLLAAVDGLEEPYLSTIRARFFDDLPPTMIAERFHVPVETVRTRLKRGLVLLRTRLLTNPPGAPP